MRRNATFTKDNIKYIMNIEEKTASVIGIEAQVDEIIIPCSIGNFIVTSISNGAFNSSKIKSIRFSTDSQIKKIDKYSFSLSSIERIEIPASLIELEEGWCHETRKLKQIILNPSNPRYKTHESGMIIGKKTIESTIFDVIVFCSREVKSVTIPNFIKTIESYSFSECKQLTNVEFQEDSQLEIIKKSAFLGSQLFTFTIPPHLKRICQGAFEYCDTLFNFTIPKNSELEVIEKQFLYSTPIRHLSLPSSLIELKSGWCCGLSCLNSIDIDVNNPRFKIYEDGIIIGKSSVDSEVYDMFMFCLRRIKNVQIPDFIKIIGPYAFSESKIENFIVPPQITHICESAFLSCNNLQTFEIPKNSQLKSIENNAFEWSRITNLFIPSGLIDLKEDWCYAVKIKEINVSVNNQRYRMYGSKMVIGKSSIENLNYDVLVFCARDIEKVTIPSFIKKINPYSLHYCYRFNTVEFQENSQLETIEKFAFSCSSIRKIEFPQNLKKIGQDAFSSCSQLQCVEINKNSQIQIIDNNAFSWTFIESFTVPPQIKIININAFYNCRKLKIIEFSDNSQIQLNSIYPFLGCKNALIMIPVKLKCL